MIIKEFGARDAVTVLVIVLVYVWASLEIAPIAWRRKKHREVKREKKKEGITWMF